VAPEFSDALTGVLSAEVSSTQKHVDMGPLRGEPVSVLSAQADLSTEFDFAERLYRFWMRRYCSELERSDLPPRVITVGVLLTTQACRLYRSIIEECHRSEGLCANVLARSLYETLISLRFVLKRSLRIIIAPSSPGAVTHVARAPSRNNRAIGNAALTREHRASLYLLHVQFESERLLRKCGATPRSQRALRLKRLRSDPAAQSARAAMEQFVGPEWVYVLSHEPHTYSGLSIESLARLVGPNRKLGQWYAGHYHIQSGMVHTAVALRHKRIGSDRGIELALHSPVDEIRDTIQIAATMLLGCMATVQNEVRRGASLGAVLESMDKDFRRIFGTDTN
jgi:hypothetical protein